MITLLSLGHNPTTRTMRGTVDTYQKQDATVTIEFDTGLAVGAEHIVIVDGPDYTVTRSFYFDEFNEQYARNFADKVIEDEGYREKCLDGTANWKQVAGIYEQAARRIYTQFEETEGKLLGYTAGDDDEKERYERATERMHQLCREVFRETKRAIRKDPDTVDLSDFINSQVQEAKEFAESVDPHATPDLAIGDRVEDVERDSDPAVIVSLPNDTIETHLVTDDETVLDYNEDYPPDTPVAVVAFEEELDTTVEDWRALSTSELETAVENQDASTYSYPISRLKPIGTE